MQSFWGLEDALNENILRKVTALQFTWAQVSFGLIPLDQFTYLASHYPSAWHYSFWLADDSLV